MKLTWIFAALAPFAVCGVLQSGESLLKTHTETLQKAKSVVVKFTVQPIGGAPEEHKLTLSREFLAKWEGPDFDATKGLTTFWWVDKAKKTYRELTAGEAAAKLGDKDAMLTWSAFFDAKWPERVATSKIGKTRMIKGNQVTEVDVTFNKRPGSATLYFDTKMGLFRGGLWKAEDGGQTVISCESIELSDKALDTSAFNWSPPSDYKKAEEAAAEEANAPVTYQSVRKIFASNCFGCHSGGNAKAGLDLTTYEGLMSRGIVVAGDPGSSSILKNLRGERRQMPPTGRLPQATIAKIEKWIADGAKND